MPPVSVSRVSRPSRALLRTLAVAACLAAISACEAPSNTNPRRNPQATLAAPPTIPAPEAVQAAPAAKRGLRPEVPEPAGMTFAGDPCTVDCSGHEAGYQWAEDRGIADPEDCGGNSQSFIEGCQAFADGR